MKTIRIRIYSKLYGNEDFVGVNLHSLVMRASSKVAAYCAAGNPAHYIGQI
jgi:hypothetical protein